MQADGWAQRTCSNSISQRRTGFCCRGVTLRRRHDATSEQRSHQCPCPWRCPGRPWRHIVRRRHATVVPSGTGCHSGSAGVTASDRLRYECWRWMLLHDAGHTDRHSNSSNMETLTAGNVVVAGWLTSALLVALPLS